MKISAISCVFVLVSDVASARKFYSSVLGLGKPSLDTPTWLEWRLGKGSVFAVHKECDSVLEGCIPSRSTVRFSFEVPDIRKAYTSLFEKGVKVLSEPREGTGCLLVDFLDPDGNLLQLVQYVKRR